MIYGRIAEYIFGEDEDRIEKLVVQHLKDKKLKLKTAESCTGGLIAAKIVGVSGASEVFESGVITYSNESKMEYLNVKSEIISEILGHSNSSITLDRYASRYTFEVLKKEIDKIEFI